jgi:hypothetical protein
MGAAFVSMVVWLVFGIGAGGGVTLGAFVASICSSG